MNKHRHSRCHYKRDSGSVPAGMNNLHTRRPTGRQTPSGSPATAPATATTTSAPGGKTAAATASGQTLRRKSPRPRRTRTSHSSWGDGGPGVRAESAISSAEKPSPAATTLAPTAAFTCPPTPHQRASAARKRAGRSSLSSSPRKREWDRPGARAPPSRRTTCCETPWCGRPSSPGQKTECCTLAGQQQFAFPGMAGGRLLRRAGGWFPPPEAEGRSGTPAHAKASPGSPHSSASARMTKILEAEGGAEAAARLASPHQTAHW
jgi:hypothetical protein